MTGAVIGGILPSLEVFARSSPAGSSLRSAPLPVYLAAKTLIYLIVILFGLSLGERIFPSPDQLGVQGKDGLVSLAAALVVVFMHDVNRLLGRNVLLNFVAGRYHAPRGESRVFLFLDMKGSTGLAERLGPLGFHRLLNRFVLDLPSRL
jgi:adenylate cyclase